MVSPDPDLEGEIDGLVVDNSAEGLFQIHARAFTDERLFELEKKRIFDRTWLYAAHESELSAKGSFVARRVGTRDLIITRDPDGKLRAMVNACLHRGARVCREESGCAKHFQCPYHGWTYDTRGTLVGLPGEDAYKGSTFDRSGLGLRHLPHIESYRGFIFVNASRDTISLSEHLADAKEFVDLLADQAPDGWELLGGCHRYAMRTNWKLTAENGVDNYHFRVLHRRYLNFIREKGGEATAVGEFQPIGRSFNRGHGGNEHEGHSSLGRMAGRWGPLFAKETEPLLEAARKNLIERLGRERADRITRANRSLRLFPNTYIIDVNNTSLRTFMPTSINTVEITEWALAPKGEHPDLRAARLRTHSGIPGPASMVSPDDVETLETCQRGLEHEEMTWLDCSRGMLRKPVPLPTDEVQQRAFFRYWHELVTLSRVPHPDHT